MLLVGHSIISAVIECRTLSICNSVVFPALSSPRKSNLACLFASLPLDANR